MASDEMHPFNVGRKFAEGVVAKSDFSEGGYRICRRDKRIQKVTADQIVEWLSSKGSPSCLICGKKTELVTDEDLRRNPL
jgi:hypothetical protein